ncbi:hypothetical protein FH972_021905 [Carpinus fangiana]|uniref:STI1 domain-containing protein n=1 Tax=Carpinus fangiana TaxID=176857 RepID=A0A5N6KQP5_9ROSI|nr:hypothetical protein FH972_021905 [Carpinus fangiana]
MSQASSSPAETKKRLALAIVDFLNTSLTDGTVAQDDRESIEVASSCISDAFKIDPSSTTATSEALDSDQSLFKIYSVYENIRGKSTSSTKGESNTEEAKPSTPTIPATSAKNPEAEALKGQGNVAMQGKDYAKAIEMYSKAIELSPTNPIYLSNRAAAYSATSQHELARNDAEMAVASDPQYTKAWSRLGLARYALGDAKGSMDAYKNGIDAEGSGGSDAMKRGYETAKRRVQETNDEANVGSTRAASPGSASAGGVPDLGGLASMLGGGGPGGQGGGMPDLSSLMNNPMMRQMAQNIMSNPSAMQNMMSNPRIQQMMNQFGGGAGGTESGDGPDLASLMQDPSIAELARNFMGGAGGAPGSGAPAPRCGSPAEGGGLGCASDATRDRDTGNWRQCNWTTCVDADEGGRGGGGSRRHGGDKDNRQDYSAPWRRGRDRWGSRRCPDQWV